MNIEWKYDREGYWSAQIESIGLSVSINHCGYFEASVDSFCVTTTATSLNSAQKEALIYAKSKIKKRAEELLSLLSTLEV